MTPEQITEKLNLIIDWLDQAHAFAIDLDRELQGSEALEDIHSELDAAELKFLLGVCVADLLRARDTFLPEHFERLRSGTP